MDKDYPPLSASCVKNLVDKLFEKRKLATPEIERITKESFGTEKHGDIVKLLGYFSQDFLMSPNPHMRKGGLLGLASVAVGLKQNAGLYFKSIIPSVLRTMHDNDARVRYYACETLYNVMKITRRETLSFLGEVFDAVSRGVADPDMSVRKGAIQCDRLLKEIVTEPDFVDLSIIVSLLRERIYTNNPHSRQFIVSWTTTLHAIPGLKISTYLPQLLDGLFRILGDPNPDIRRQCEILLTDLLNEIVANSREIVFDAMINSLIVHCRLSATACVINEGLNRPPSPYKSPTTTEFNTGAVIMDTSTQSAFITQNPVGTITSTQPNGLTTSGEQLQQRTALTWILAFVELDAEHMLPFAAGIIAAVLPCFSLYNTTTEAMRTRRATLETAVRINETLLNYVSTFRLKDLPESSTSQSDRSAPETSSMQLEHPVGENCTLRAAESVTGMPQTIDTLLDTTCRLLEHQALLTRLAALRWIEVLGQARPLEVLSHVARLLPLMLKLLDDPSTDVVHSVIRLFGCLCDHSDVIRLLDENTLTALNIPQELFDMLVTPPPSRPSGGARSLRGKTSGHLMNRSSPVNLDNNYYCNVFCVRFLLDLVWFFDKNTQLLAQRGDMIITDLCYVLTADVVYRVLSAILSHMTELRSSSVLVQALNRILLTQPALHEFRNRLRAIRTEDDCHLLERLYRAWCHNPVALLSLYMLTQNYQQANRLIKSFGEIYMTVDTLVEMDQLIQLIESPIFSTLRMHLLDKRYSADLRETLYCLLMCLPQTEAFQTLWRRLQCIPPVSNLSDWEVRSGRPQPDFQLINAHIQFDALFNHFHALQTKRVISSNRRTEAGSVTCSPSTSTKGDFQQSGNLALRTRPNVAPVVSNSSHTDGAAAVGSATDYLEQCLAKLNIHLPVSSVITNSGNSVD
ncbi:HEAT repeat protein [Paragonimus heterotremus]|uniref:Protein VAC14 homolog n=1 Tax=Paragonimus heterotremus TaxID=100268 RepID=A0A8J4SX59_9TREM|nr:HEAT repeat protein [Paragonimus heterotremus]